jgi:hypothetical protein
MLSVAYSNFMFPPRALGGNLHLPVNLKTVIRTQIWSNLKLGYNQLKLELQLLECRMDEQEDN